MVSPRAGLAAVAVPLPSDTLPMKHNFDVKGL